MNTFWHYAPLLAVAFAAVGLFTGVIASGLKREALFATLTRPPPYNRGKERIR